MCRDVPEPDPRFGSESRKTMLTSVGCRFLVHVRILTKGFRMKKRNGMAGPPRGLATFWLWRKLGLFRPCILAISFLDRIRFLK